MKNLVVDELILEDVNCFDRLIIEFRPGYNLICGTNGIGKTSILNAIGVSFSALHAVHSVRQRASSGSTGRITLKATIDGAAKTSTLDAITNSPGQSTGLIGGLNDESKWIIYINTKRDFSYAAVNSVDRDIMRGNHDLAQHAASGIDHHETKKWFINRYLFYPHKSTWPIEHAENFLLAKKCFSILDPNVLLKEVQTSTYDIIVSTCNGDIPYEYLSSGFRSSLSLFMGIIREIEFRKLGTTARDFKGVILIDELDMHLHPTWQRIIPSALQEAFPSAQLIVTTHSPHIIQNASEDQIIALKTDKNGQTRINVIETGKYGFKGWSVEEILEDVMGVNDSYTDLFRDRMKKFDQSIDSDDAKEIIRYRDELEELLHPSNPLRKLIRIQSAPYAGDLS